MHPYHANCLKGVPNDCAISLIANAAKTQAGAMNNIAYRGFQFFKNKEDMATKSTQPTNEAAHHNQTLFFEAFDAAKAAPTVANAKVGTPNVDT